MPTAITATSAASTRSLPPDDVAIPTLGFGVWDSAPAQCVASCLAALRAGYRHIDTGDCYGNEDEVGDAVRRSGIAREDLFLSTKVLLACGSVQASYEHIVASVEKLGGKGGYADMMLIHNAAVGEEKVKELWQALERAYREKRVRCIGVSNHGIGHLKRLEGYAEVWPPAVNQLELHPWCQQREVVQYCQERSIPIEAYCPLARNTKAHDPTVRAAAEAHGVTAAQVLLRWSLQKGWIPLAKSDNPERIVKNADVFGFALTDEEMAGLDALDQKSAGSLVLAVSND